MTTKVGLSGAYCSTPAVSCYTTSDFSCVSNKCSCALPYTWTKSTKTCDCESPYTLDNGSCGMLCHCDI